MIKNFLILCCISPLFVVHASEALNFKLSDRLIQLDHEIDETIDSVHGPERNPCYANAIDLLIENDTSNELKRVSFALTSIVRIKNILFKNHVEKGKFINNIDSATPWICNKKMYYTIYNMRSFVVTNDVYKLLKSEHIFDSLKNARLPK